MSNAINTTADLLDELPEDESNRAHLVRRHGSEDERLLDLFWNRAELKKQFSGLKDELDKAGDALQNQIKETKRAEHEKRALEKLLVDPDMAYNAIVYYQLRELWDAAHRQLQTFTEELSNQQKDRERKKQIMEFNQERQRRLQEVSATIVTVKAEADSAKTALQSVEQQFEELGGLLNFFRRRRMMPMLEQHREHYDSVRQRIEELFDRRIKIESEPWPEYPGLALEGKRVINLAVIAMVQHLYIHFSENSLGSMARVTTLKRVHEVKYGTKSDCEYIMNRIRDALHSMNSDRGFAGELRARSKYLRSIIEYRSDHDTFPVAGSIGNIPIAVPGVDLGNTVAGMPLEINVMVDDYWEMSAILLR